MTQEINQKISQFIDEELKHKELDHLLSKVKGDPELISKIMRYQVIRHALRSENVVLTDNGFLAQINQQIK